MVQSEGDIVVEWCLYEKPYTVIKIKMDDVLRVICY